jgi:hypothetical protein
MTETSAHNRPVVALASRSFSARTGLVAIFAGIFGLVAYVWLTTPAEEPNIAQDTGRLALALDTAIRERGLALDSVTNSLAVEGFLKDGGTCARRRERAEEFPRLSEAGSYGPRWRDPGNCRRSAAQGCSPYFKSQHRRPRRIGGGRVHGGVGLYRRSTDARLLSYA